MLMCIQVFVLILSIGSPDIELKRNDNGTTELRNDGTTEGQGKPSLAPAFQSGDIMMVL